MSEEKNDSPEQQSGEVKDLSLEDLETVTGGMGEMAKKADSEQTNKLH